MKSKSLSFLKLSFVTLGIFASSMAYALEIVPYTAADFQAAQKNNESVALFFHADWCPVCKSQMTTLENLKSTMSLKNFKVFKANYDTEKDLKKDLKVRTQSVFVVYKGNKEMGRIIGDTDPKKIQAGLEKGL